jgi:hypothetical protein
MTNTRLTKQGFLSKKKKKTPQVARKHEKMLVIS